MRVALLIDQYFRFSGVGHYSRRLVEAILAEDRQTEYLLVRPASADSLELSAPNAREVRLPRRMLLYPLWHTLKRPNLERFTGPVDLTHVLSGAVVVPTRGPILHTIHDLASTRRPQDYMWRRRWFKQRMLRDLVGRKQGVHWVTISQATRDDMEALFGIDPSAVRVIYNGLDHDMFQPASPEQMAAARARYQLPERFFFSLGLISPRKNLELIFDAMEQLAGADGFEDLHWVFAGSEMNASTAGPLYDRYRTHPKRDRLHFIGTVASGELAPLYGAAEALLYPSHWEGFGLPILEAMACATPVVCSNTSSMPEVAGDAAILISPDSVDQLVDGMRRLWVKNDDTSELVGRGLKRAAEFTWQKTAKQMIAAYRDCVAAPGFSRGWSTGAKR